VQDRLGVVLDHGMVLELVRPRSVWLWVVADNIEDKVSIRMVHPNLTTTTTTTTKTARKGTPIDIRCKSPSWVSAGDSAVHN
jgi:hypothetical protein